MLGGKELKKVRKSLAFTYVKIFIAISLIALVIYYAINFVREGYNEEEFETVKTDMLALQGKIEILSQQVETKTEDVEYVGTEIEQKENETQIQNLINNNIIDIDSEDSNYYCIDNSNLQELGLEIQTDSYYIVDYEQNDVIYVDGIKDSSGNIVYKLSDME